MTTFARGIALAMVGIATTLLWLYCSVFLPHELARGHGGAMLADRIAGTVTLLALVVAPALPVQTLFPRHPVRAAAAVGWMPLALGTLFAYSTEAGAPGAHGIGMAIIEGWADWLAIVLGAWGAQRLRQKMRD